VDSPIVSPVAFTALPATAQWVAGLVLALQGVFGESHVRVLRFAVRGADTPDWLIQHTLEGSRFDLGPLLLSSTFAQAAPQLAADVDPDRMACFEQLPSFGLDGELAGVLAAGGVDIRLRLPAPDAHAAASGFVDALIGARFDEVFVLHTRTAWSRWFACDVWDRTWVVADASTDQVWLLCVTDATGR
jgi:hypothetical protein